MCRFFRWLFPGLFLLPCCWVSGQPLTIVNITPPAHPVTKYSRCQITFNLNRLYSGGDPFDPTIIDVSAVITSPTARQWVIPAFYTQDFTISSPSYEAYTPNGAPYWKVFFTPDETGIYSFFLRAREGGNSTSGPEDIFEVADSTNKGFIGIHTANPYFLQYSDGSQYLPIGHNIAFGDGNPSNLNGTAYYSSLLSTLASAKGNWTRIWMTDFERSSLEWSSGHWSGFYSGAGIYSLKAAYRVEKILEIAESKGIAVQLVLNDHGQFSSWVDARWNDNPYNSLKGGPVPSSNPEQFFTNTTAKELHKRRLRYLVARYGAFPNLLCWELFNEVQFCGRNGANWFNSTSVRNGIRDWHREMAGWLKANDPFSHLVSTSSDGPTFDLLWSLPEIDLLQIHDYSAPSSEKDITLASAIRNLYSRFEKPVFVGEFGLESSPECNFNPNTYNGTTADREHLLQGTHLHNALWAAAMTGTGAGTWWWGCYLEPDTSRSRTSPGFPLHNHHYPPLAAFFENEPLAEEDLIPSNLSLPQGVVGFGLASTSCALVWIRDALNAFGSGAAPGNLEPVRTLNGIKLTIPEIDEGIYQIDFYHPWTGEPIGISESKEADHQGLALTLPAFERDIALKVHSQPAAVPNWTRYSNPR